MGRTDLAFSIALACACACTDGSDPEPRAKPLPVITSEAPGSERSAEKNEKNENKAIAFVPRCSDGPRPEQRYGSTCVCCHAEFGVAGSIDREGPPVSRIVVTDARGDVADTAPNMFSNFFRHFAMTGPFRAVAYGPDGRSIEMQADAPSADCNACHYKGGPVPMIHGP
jgi:hypothetical protein